MGGKRHPVPAAELPFEYMLNVLRLSEGFTLASFGRATGLSAEAVVPLLRKLGGRGLMVENGETWVPTEQGFRFLHDLQEAFPPDQTGSSASRELYTAPSRFVPERDFRHIVSEMP